MVDFNHSLSTNKYNSHAWILGSPDIGDDVWIGAFCVIDALHAPLRIGRGTNVSSGAQILTHSTVKRCISERRYGKVDSSRTEIGEFSFIGTNAVVLKGAVVGHHSVVAAGAVVPEDMQIPPYSVVAGVPARIVGKSEKYLKGVQEESISVVIPAYNEEVTLENVVLEAKRELEKLKLPYEIVLVDDGSGDKTGEIIDRLAKTRNIRGIHHKVNKGFTGAIKTAYQSAKNHLVILAPADGQFNFGQLKKFIEGIKGYDAAAGYRAVNPEPFNRKLNSWVFHKLCRLLLGIRLKEISTVIMWRKPVLDSINVESEEASAMILPELVAKALRKGYRFAEIPIHFELRKGGVGKGTKPIMIIKTILGMLKFSYHLRQDHL